MILELPIYHHTDGTRTLKGLGLDYQIEDCEIRPITFYHIDAISPYIDNSKEYGSIHTNDSEYTCPLNYPSAILAVAAARQAGEKMITYYAKYQNK